MQNLTGITINKKAEKSARSGHPWIYGAEVLSVDGEYKNGDIVNVFTQNGKYIGSGFINDNSKILVRLITENANDTIDDAFWARRFKYALEHRINVLGEENISACRLVFSDSDGFPGLIIDRFSDVLSVEVLSLGIDIRKNRLIKILLGVLSEYGIKISCVYERSEQAVRAKEGLEKHAGYIDFDGSERKDGKVIIEENGIKYEVDYENGQKTGFFLDQKFNRLAVAKLAKGKTVLDCFTHTGAFALNAKKGGAKSVTAVDISMDACIQADKNAALNGWDDIDFVCSDVFEYLTHSPDVNSGKFDFIILDPPAFTKSGSTVESAYRGYKEINLKAMKLLPRGGYLATCSCSHFMTDELFRRMIKDAADDAKVRLLEVENRRQAPDHPILWGVPETEYLKFYLFRVI